MKLPVSSSASVVVEDENVSVVVFYNGAYVFPTIVFR
jgi:hypothetical protein